jgi:carbamoylphosphate synthase large subunit
MIGVDVNAINITEDREQFKQLLKDKCTISTC